MLAAIGLVVHKDYCELQHSHTTIVGLSAGAHLQLGLCGLGRSTMMGAETIVVLGCCWSIDLSSLVSLFLKLQPCLRIICSHSTAAGLSAGTYLQLGLCGLGRSTMMGAETIVVLGC